MPQKNSDGVGDRTIPQFVKYRMSEDEMADYMSNQTIDEEGIFTFMSEMVEQKIKFSCSYDPYGGGCQAFLTPSQPEDPNIGFTLSARAPDLTNAIGLLQYKHTVLFKRVWPKDHQQSGSSWG